MTDDERRRLAGLITSQRKRAFGTKRAAYNAAQVNAATWDHAENGDPMREDRLREVVRALWPESDGDWQTVLAGTYVAAPGDGARGDADTMSNGEIVAAMREMSDALREMGERISRLEGRPGE